MILSSIIKLKNIGDSVEPDETVILALFLIFFHTYLLKRKIVSEYGDGFRPLVRNFRPVNAE